MERSSSVRDEDYVGILYMGDDALHESSGPRTVFIINFLYPDLSSRPSTNLGIIGPVI